MTSKTHDHDVSASVQGSNPSAVARWLADTAPSASEREQARALHAALECLTAKGTALALQVVALGDAIPAEFLPYRAIACRLSREPRQLEFVALVNGPGVTGKVGTTRGVLLTVLDDLVSLAHGTVQYIARDSLRADRPGISEQEHLGRDMALWPGLPCLAVQCGADERWATIRATADLLSHEPGTSGSITTEYIDKNGKPSQITFSHVSERMFYENQRVQRDALNLPAYQTND